MHTFPQIFMLSEWRYSSIPFSWHRFGIYIFAMSAYGLVNLSLEERYADDIYSSMDWINKPKESTMFALGANLCIFLGFLIMKSITDIKLRVDPDEEEWQIYFNYDPNVQASRLLSKEIDLDIVD